MHQKRIGLPSAIFGRVVVSCYLISLLHYVLFQTKNKKWIIRGVKMSSAQIKRQIEQERLDTDERRKQENLKR
jgi:hypothetical protein